MEKAQLREDGLINIRRQYHAQLALCDNHTQREGNVKTSERGGRAWQWQQQHQMSIQDRRQG